MGKISVDAFLREYSVAAKQKGTAMETFIKKHIVTDYVPYLEKEVLCTNIINATCYIPTEEKIIKFNTPARHILYIMNLINLYTDIEISFKDTDSVEQYDKLTKAGASYLLINAIPDAEYAEFNNMLNMKLDDLRDNEYSLEAIVYNFTKSLSISEEVINSAIEEIKKQAETAK